VVDAELIAAFEEIVARYDAALEGAVRLDGYLGCLTAADAGDEAARVAESEWRAIKAGLAALAPRFTTWASTIDLAPLLAGSAVARAHEPMLRRLQTAAAHLMAPGEEALAAELAPSSVTAWMNLHDELLALATSRIEIDGEVRELPLSEIDNLLIHPDRAVRRRGFETANAVRRSLAIPLAAALNGIKGQQLALARRRGWDDPLDQALFANAIDRPILDTMLAVMHEALPDFRRYLRARARLLRLPVLAGYDLVAPLGEPAPWPFETARAFIVAAFTDFSPRLGALAERAFRARWIDAAPRAGKEVGAFCTFIQNDESRILANYLPVFGGMGLLAHELGHAYSNVAIYAHRRTFLQAPPEFSPTAYPLTLAETASTLCTTIVERAARAAHPEDEIVLLDESLRSFALDVFGIMPMFAFEREVFAARAQRELPAAELEALMAAAWHDVAGDALDPATVWSMEWTRGHFAIDNVWYYSFPYAFGLLFGLGLLAVRDAQPEGFMDRFDLLLADSGMREASELAAGFGIDLRDATFWRAACDLFRADVDRYEALSRQT
jgi:oligoendopeptidase F